MKDQLRVKHGAMLALAATALGLLPSTGAAANWNAKNVSELISNINAANLAGGVNTITLAPGKTYTLTAVNNTADGPNGLPVIAANNHLTVRGNGATIARSTARGTPTFRLFEVASGASLTLESLTLANGLVVGDTGQDACGGAILNAAGACLTVKCSVVCGNQVVGGDGGGGLGGLGFGGAICSDGTASFDYVLLRGNQATGGATTNPDPANYDTSLGGLAFGGAISSQNSGALTVRNCLFTGNKAIGGHRHAPSALYDGAGVSGAIDSWGTASISGTTFTDNQALGGTADEGVDAGYAIGGALGSGGPLALTPVCTIQNCRFSRNQALGADAGPGNYSGAGVAGALSTGYAQISAATTITGCWFTDNQAVGGMAELGNAGVAGAINQESPSPVFIGKSSLTIANSVFAGNKAVGGGVGAMGRAGAIVNQDYFADDGSAATLVISNCTFAGNEALGTPGADGVNTIGIGESGAVDTGGSTTILNSTFVNNRAVGGALSPAAMTGFVVPSSGGALSSWGGTLDIRDSRFVGNQVVGGDVSLGGPASSAMGGGITVFSGLTASIVNCSLSYNAAVGGAGGSAAPGGDGVGGGLNVGFFPTVWAVGSSSAVTVTGTIISHNQAIGGTGGGKGKGGGYAVGAGVLFGLPDTSSVTLNGGTVVNHNQPGNAFQF